MSAFGVAFSLSNPIQPSSSQEQTSTQTAPSSSSPSAGTSPVPRISRSPPPNSRISPPSSQGGRHTIGSPPPVIPPSAKATPRAPPPIRVEQLNRQTLAIVQKNIEELKTIIDLGVIMPKSTLRVNPFDSFRLANTSWQYYSFYLTIVGPRASCYEGRLFDLMFIFDNRYPEHEPLIQFVPQEYSGEMPKHLVSFLFIYYTSYPSSLLFLSAHLF